MPWFRQNFLQDKKLSECNTYNHNQFPCNEKFEGWLVLLQKFGMNCLFFFLEELVFVHLSYPGANADDFSV